MCQICLIPFSFLVRKHHCRSCGRVVCSVCSKYKMIFNDRETPYRVCSSCYFEYQKEGKCDCGFSLKCLQIICHPFLLLVSQWTISSFCYVMAKNQVEHTKSERKILEEMNCLLCKLIDKYIETQKRHFIF